MRAASGLANAVDAPAISVESSGWEWSSEIKSVLDKAVAEVNKLQAAEEGVVNALEVMLVSDDLQLENSSVSSAAAEGLSRVHFQLQQAGGRESDLAKQVNDLLQRQMDLEVRHCERQRLVLHLLTPVQSASCNIIPPLLCMLMVTDHSLLCRATSVLWKQQIKATRQALVQWARHLILEGALAQKFQAVRFLTSRAPGCSDMTGLWKPQIP